MKFDYKFKLIVLILIIANIIYLKISRDIHNYTSTQSEIIEKKQLKDKEINKLSDKFSNYEKSELEHLNKNIRINDNIQENNDHVIQSTENKNYNEKKLKSSKSHLFSFLLILSITVIVTLMMILYNMEKDTDLYESNGDYFLIQN